MRKIKRLKQYLVRLRNTIESQWTCVPSVELFNMMDHVHALCVGKVGMMKNPAPLRVPLPRKEKKRLRKSKGYVHAVTQKGIEHKSVHGMRPNPYVTVCSRELFRVVLQTNGFRRCAGLFSSIVTLKGGLSRWLLSSGGPCRVY